MELIYRLEAGTGGQQITCLLCQRTSHNPHDCENLYCGNCHLFFESVIRARRMHAAGASHECSEWPTATHVCAVCNRALERTPSL